MADSSAPESGSFALPTRGWIIWPECDGAPSTRHRRKIVHQFHIADSCARESLRQREKHPLVYALTLGCETDMINLFQIAGENVARLFQRFEDAKKASKDGGTLLEGFAQCVYNTGGISINMRPCVLSDLIARRKYQNIYEWALEQSALCSRPVPDVLREKLGKYYSRRIHFDDSFENGRAFRYGLLNIGGAGADRYGQFCAVLRVDFVEGGTEVAYLKADSLGTYMRTETDLNETAIRQDVATHSHRHCLTALKHGAALGSSDPNDWPAIVCSSDDYVEAIFLKDVDLATVDEVRLRETEFRRLFDLAFSDYTQKHDDATNALKTDFVTILRADREGRFRLEKV